MAIPVTLEDARRQLRIEDNDASQDTELQGFINDAAAWIEKYTGHILVARDVTETFRGFGTSTLRAWPIKPTAAIGLAYVDANGTPVALTGGTLDVSQRPARVIPAGGCFWPFRNAHQIYSVTVRAGYEDGDAVPGNFRRAMLVLIGAYDADREGGDILTKAEATARSLCYWYRARAL